MQENRKKREDMCMQKNDTVVVEITDIGVNGEGIGKIDGYTLFIKDAVIGDVAEVKVIKAKKNYGYARLINVLNRQTAGLNLSVLSQEMRGLSDSGNVL